ncbi:elongation factor 1-delta [Fagus crenata]
MGRDALNHSLSIKLKSSPPLSFTKPFSDPLLHSTALHASIAGELSDPFNMSIDFIEEPNMLFFKKSTYLARMAVTFYDVNSPSGLKKLDDYLLTRSYISGYQASKDDVTVHAALSKAPSAEYVNVSRWYSHIDALLRISGVSGEGSGVTVEGCAPITEEAIATPPVGDTKAAAAVDDDDDDVDLFGEETEEEKKAAEERAAAVKAAGKKKESGKSSVLLDVKPWDDETDMKKLEEAVRSVHMEGLLWGASKLVPVGYGIKKLTIMLTIVDDLVSVDTLIEERLTVEPINEYVQSCDIVAFNKILISLSLHALLDFDRRNIVCLIARFGMLILFSLFLILVAELEDAFVCVGTGEDDMETATDLAALPSLEDDDDEDPALKAALLEDEYLASEVAATKAKLAIHL